jgi:hypothetical protein
MPTHGLLVVALLVDDAAEQIECAGMFGVDLENPPVECLGLRHATVLVVFDRHLEGIVYVV